MTALPLVATLVTQARADEPAPDAPTTSLFHRFEVGIGLDAGGPILFRDTPNASLDGPTVYQYGTRLGFRFGEPGVDAHRPGVTLGIHSLARATDRSLLAVDPQLVYATGGATELQFGAGWRVASASDGFRSGDEVPYGGPLGSVELRHSFLDADATTPIGLVVGGFAEAVLGTPTTYSTAFVGVRLDLTYRKH